MDIAIDYSSPFIFATIISALLAFFVLFRNYRLHLNALLGVLSVFSGVWFFLFYLSELGSKINTTVYIVTLSAVLSYFILLLLHREQTLKINIKRIMPEGYLFLPSWISMALSIEILLIGLMLFVFILASSKIISLPNFISPTAKSITLIFSLIFLAESVILAMVSAVRLLGRLRMEPSGTFEKIMVCLFGLFWLIFSLGCLILSVETRYGAFMLENNTIIPLLVTSLLAILLLQSLFIARRYFLSYKVLLTQFIVALIVIFNLASILNSGSVEEIILRAILILILGGLSHLLVRSVVSEIQKRQRVQDTTQEIYKANKTLHKLDRAKSDFITAASHQLRNPLSVIKGIGSMLLDGSYGKLSGTVKDALEKVYISNERLIGLIEDLLDISHLEDGRVDFNFEKKDLGVIAQKAVDGLTLQAQNKKLSLNFFPWKKSKLLAWVDEQKVTEAISNLIDNAIKYTRKGGVKVRVKKSGNNVRVIVTDTGIGLRKEEIKNLFQKFVRTGRGNKMSTVGTGLGLYVVRKMIEAHRGKLRAESTGEGRGSSFIIELPLNQKNPPDKKFIQRMVMEKKPA